MWVLYLMGELKNRNWELNAHLFLSLDLNESEPLDLRVAQKLFRETKEGKEKRDYIQSFFMSRLEKGGWELEKSSEREICWNKLKEWFLGKVGLGNQGIEDNKMYSSKNI